MIPLEQLLRGHLYRLQSRNLRQGVYDGRGGFIGVREKFGYRYLFTEYYYTGSDGTANALEDLGPIPDDIQALEDLGTVDRGTNRLVAFDRPVAEGGRGWYYIDTDDTDQNIDAVTVSNVALFDYLESLRPAEVPNDRTLNVRDRLKKS